MRASGAIGRLATGLPALQTRWHTDCGSVQRRFGVGFAPQSLTCKTFDHTLVQDREKRPSSAPLQDAVRHIASCVRPISIVEPGSGRKRFVGSAVVVASGSQRVIVTAAHVVEGSEHKLVGMSPKGSIPWPTNYSLVEPLDDSVPPIDLAFCAAEV